MRIAVLGAGVIGVTSAYYLHRAGHEVIVIDRRCGPALETSFANAGEISPGYASPWAAPGVPLKAIAWMLMQHSPLIVRPTFDFEMARWIFAMLRNCNAASYARNKARMVRLAEFSRDQLGELRSELPLSYDERTRGTLQLFRSTTQLKASANDIAVLDQYGIKYEKLDRDACVECEPGLAASRERFVGGLRLPGDETGDCHAFTSQLAQYLAERGVEFRYDCTVNGLHVENGRVASVETDHGPITANRYVVALAAHSAALLRPLGIRLPVYPIKGYSITAAIADHALAPVSTLLDETYKVAITRLGNRIRVGGMAEISGFSHDLPDRRRATLIQSLTDLFPKAAHLGDLSFWSGLRPMTPDGPPILGPTKLPNLFLNVGHGTLGWTMACGSGHILSSIVDGASPAIESGDLALSRY